MDDIVRHYNLNIIWLQMLRSMFFILIDAGKNCESLGELENGEIHVTGVTDRSVALYDCDSPYTLDGLTVRQCMNGVWTGDEPKCKCKINILNFVHGGHQFIASTP